MKTEPAEILVVDDELGMREGIRRLFEAQGHHVDTAENGESGIALGTAREYDLYFLDLKMHMLLLVSTKLGSLIPRRQGSHGQQMPLRHKMTKNG